MPPFTDLDPHRRAEASVPRLASPSGTARARPGRPGPLVVRELGRQRIPTLHESDRHASIVVANRHCQKINKL